MTDAEKLEADLRECGYVRPLQIPLCVQWLLARGWRRVEGEFVDADLGPDPLPDVDIMDETTSNNPIGPTHD